MNQRMQQDVQEMPRRKWAPCGWMDGHPWKATNDCDEDRRCRTMMDSPPQTTEAETERGEILLLQHSTEKSSAAHNTEQRATFPTTPSEE